MNPFYFYFGVIFSITLHACGRPTLVQKRTKPLAEPCISNYDTAIFPLIKDTCALFFVQKTEEQDLYRYMEHQKPIVRLHAYFGFLKSLATASAIDSTAEEAESKRQDLIWRAFQDTAKFKYVLVNYYTTDTFELETGFYFLLSTGFLMNNYLMVDYFYTGFPSEKSRAFVDSLVLFTKPKFSDTTVILNCIDGAKPNPVYYDIVKKSAANDEGFAYVTLLSKYQKESDIPLILDKIKAEIAKKERFSSAWRPLWHFQHPQLQAVLSDSVCQYMRDGTFWRAVYAFKDSATLEILEKAYRCIQPENKHYLIAKLISQMQYGDVDSIYFDFYEKVLSENNENSNINPPEAFIRARPDTMLYFYEKWLNGNRHTQYRAQKVYPILQKVLSARRSKAEIEIVLSQIKVGSDYYRKAKLSFAQILKDKHPDYIEPLFLLLEAEPIGINRFYLAKTLHSYGQKEIDDRLIAFFEAHPELQPSIEDATKGGRYFSDFIHFSKR